MHDDVLTIFTFIIPIFAILGVFLLFKYLAQVNHYLGRNKVLHLLTESNQAYYLSVVSRHHAMIGINLPSKYKDCSSIHKETLLDKFFKLICISQEFQCNDKQFDQKYYITSENHSFCKELYNNKQAREIIDKLFSLPIKFLGTERNMLWVNHKEDYKPPEEEIENIVTNLYLLLEIIEQLDYTASDEYLVEKWRFVIKTSGKFYLLAIGLVIYIMCFEKLILDGMFESSLKYSLPIALILSLFVIKTFFRSSRGHQAVKYSIMILLPLVSILIYDIMYILNVALDSSKATIYEVSVISKEKRRRAKGGTSYKIRTTPFLSAHKQYTLYDSRDLYNCLNIGDEVKLSIKDGFFGFKWIESETPIMQCSF